MTREKKCREPQKEEGSGAEMIRRVEHTLKFATAAKRQRLDDFFAEYARVVNAFIVLYWNTDVLPGKANSEVYGQVDSWMMGKARKCAAN